MFFSFLYIKMSNLIQHIEKSLELSNNYQSKITEKTINNEWYEWKKTRHFYNNICSILYNLLLFVHCAFYKLET